VSGDCALLGPFQDGAGLDLQVLSGLRCGEPFAVHDGNSIPDASPHPRVLNNAFCAGKCFICGQSTKIEKLTFMYVKESMWPI